MVPESAVSRSAWLEALITMGLLSGLFLASIQLTLPSGRQNDLIDESRVRAHVSRIAAAPHPIGSAANLKVRDYIAGYLSRLGLPTEIQRDTVVYKHPTRNVSSTRIGHVENIVARLKGMGTGRALALMSHYDAAAGAPGAGDAASGVAAVLEAAYQLSSTGPHRNDVVFIITDGEEMGLFGAQAYFNQNPDAKDIELVLNFDARGSSGPSLMFEASAGNGWLVHQAAEAVPGLIANSLSYEIYQRMPNDTDATIVKAAGHQVLNFAFFGDPFDYHASVDSPDNLNQDTLRQHATNAVTAALHFANIEEWLPPQADTTYFNLLPDLLVQYGSIWEWVIVVVVFALCVVVIVQTQSRRERRWRKAAYGFLAIALFIALVSNVFETWIDFHGLEPFGTLQLAARGFAPFAAYCIIATGLGIWLLTGLSKGMSSLSSLLPFGLIVLACIPAQRLNPILLAGLIPAMLGLWWLRGRVDRDSLMVGSILLWVAASALLFWQIPKAAYVTVWPLGSVALSLVITGRLPEEARLTRLGVLLLGSVVPLLILAPTVYLSYLSLGIGMPQLPMMLMALLLALLLPLVLAIGQPHKGRVGLALVLFGTIGLGVSVAGEWSSTRHPKPESLFLAVDAAAGQAYWASVDNEPSQWIREVIGPQARQTNRSVISSEIDGVLWAGVPTRSVLPAATLSVINDWVIDGKRHLSLSLQSAQRAEYITLLFPAGLEYFSASANGRSITLPDDNAEKWAWRVLGLRGASSSIELVTQADRPLDVEIVEVAYTMPNSPTIRPGNSRPRPDGWSDATVTYQTTTVPAIDGRVLPTTGSGSPE